MTDYQKALESVKNLPHIYIGQEVSTPIGKGIVVSIEMDYNGLNLNPYRTMVTVWYGTERDTCGWLKKTFNISDVKITRKQKLENINEKILENKL